MLIAWILGYGGMIYGFGGYETLMLRGFGLTSEQAFGVIWSPPPLGGGGGLAICAMLGEAVERRIIILASAVVTAAALSALYFAHTVLQSYVLVTLSWGATEVWLFSMYNYTAASYPTRLRATGTGLTDGVGHLGAVFGAHRGRLAVHRHSHLRPCRVVRLRDDPRRPGSCHPNRCLGHRSASGDPGTNLGLTSASVWSHLD